MTIQELTKILDKLIWVVAALLYGDALSAWYKDRHPVTCEPLDTE